MLRNVIDDDKTYDFCMCNPPFFDQQLCHEERSSDEEEETTDAAGSKEEISVPGGEVEFVKRIIDDSVVLRDRIK